MYHCLFAYPLVFIPTQILMFRNMKDTAFLEWVNCLRRKLLQMYMIFPIPVLILDVTAPLLWQVPIKVSSVLTVCVLASCGLRKQHGLLRTATQLQILWYCTAASTLPQRFWEIDFIKWSPVLGKKAVLGWNLCVLFLLPSLVNVSV